jgi:hypothetical protein
MKQKELFKPLFSLFVGFSMVILWTMLLITNQVPELIHSPFTTITHISAETLTGIFLIIAGYGLIKRYYWANNFFLVASGMLLYATIQAVGYYIDHLSYFFVGMFILLILINGILIFRHIRLGNSK